MMLSTITPSGGFGFHLGRTSQRRRRVSERGISASKANEEFLEVRFGLCVKPTMRPCFDANSVVTLGARVMSSLRRLEEWTVKWLSRLSARGPVTCVLSLYWYPASVAEATGSKLKFITESAFVEMEMDDPATVM
jgi:hypothetical protein